MKKNKVICIIPVLLGSSRIKDKNLILVNGHPLLSYVVNAVKKARVFDEIYLDSENEIFKKLADHYKIKFFKRDPSKGGSACLMNSKSSNCQGKRCQFHDHYISDFLRNIQCDYLVQAHTTSPLIKSDTIKDFADALIRTNNDSQFSIVENYTESLFNDKPVNFIKGKKTPTQKLQPMQVISWALSGWKSKSFINSYNENNTIDPGPTFVGKIGLFPINKIEALDVDDWDDLFIVEACLAYKQRRNDTKRFFYNEDIEEIDTDVVKLIKKDGVKRFKLSGFNQAHSNLNEIIKKMGVAPWSYPLIYTDRDQSCLIAQRLGESCRKHCHVTKDEWWIVLQGQFEWKTPKETIIAKKGEVVFLKKGTIHQITCTSKNPGIRLACGARGMEHIYVK